jgi:hypothetical protein
MSLSSLRSFARRPPTERDEAIRRLESPLPDSNRRPLLSIKVPRQLVATRGNGFGLFLRFLDSDHLPRVATGCAR